MARLDSWLWAVRMYKTRSASTAAVRGGHVRVDDKLAKPSQHVVPGQVIRVRREQEEKLIQVVDPDLEKRVGAPIAQAAYLDRTPEKPPPIPEMAGRVAIRGPWGGPPHEARAPRPRAPPRPLTVGPAAPGSSQAATTSSSRTRCSSSACSKATECPASGRRCWPPQATRRLIEEFRRGAAPVTSAGSAFGALTEREVEVLARWQPGCRTPRSRRGS